MRIHVLVPVIVFESLILRLIVPSLADCRFVHLIDYYPSESLGCCNKGIAARASLNIFSSFDTDMTKQYVKTM